MLLLDNCLSVYVLELVEADSTGWREVHDFFANFYTAYNTACLKQFMEPGPDHMVLG